MKTRAAGIFACYAVGIAAAYCIGMFSTLVIMLVALVIIGVTGIFHFKGTIFRIVLAVCVLLGAAAYTAENSATTEFEDEFVTVTGRISELPYTYDNEIYYYVIAPHTLTYMGESHSFDKRVRLSSEKLYEYGDCISAGGFLESFDEKLNDTGFDSQLYNKSRSIFYKMNEYDSRPAQKYYVISARDILLNIQNKCAQYIDSRYEGKARAYLRAFIIGDMRAFDDELYDVLIFSGAKRFLYASFIHISILMFVLNVGFALFRAGQNSRDNITAVILLIYCACMSAKSVFVKALASMIFIILYKKKFGYANRADALAAGGMTVLIANPMFVFDAGFVIAVTLSALNIMFTKYLADKLRFMGRIRYYVVQWLIGTLGGMPVYAAFFGGASLMSVIVQLAAVPLVIAILTGFYIGTFCDSVLGFTAFSDSFLSAMLFTYDSIAQFVSGLPFSYIFIPSPTLYQICLFYSIIMTIYCIITMRQKNLRIFMPAALSVSMAVVVGLGYVRDIGKMKLMFVNVGQGDGAVVSVNYRDKLLIDGGGSAAYSQYNTGRFVYVPFLRSHGIYTANAIVTHYHKDHCQGIVEAVRSIKINTLFMPDSDPQNEWRIALEEAAAEHGTEIVFAESGDKIIYKSGLVIEFISPGADDTDSDDPNEASLVAYVKYGGFSALFTGDATNKNEAGMLRAGLVEDCDVLKVAHHGSDTSSSAEFLAAAMPEVAVISVGEENSYNLPSKEVIKRLSGAEVFRTDENGNITITAEKSGEYTVEKFR